MPKSIPVASVTTRWKKVADETYPSGLTAKIVLGISVVVSIS